MNVVIPKSVTKIEWGVFEDCTSLVSVEIPESVTEIGAFAFDDCASLVSVKIPNRTKIADGAFDNCPKLKITRR